MYSLPIPRFLIAVFFTLLLSQLHSQRSCDNIWWDTKLRSIVQIEDDQEFLDSLKTNLPRAEACQNWRGVVGILNGFTFYYYGIGDFDSAYFYSSKSYEVVEREIDQLGDTSFFAINAFNDLGAIQYYFLGDIDRRIDLLERAARGIEKLANAEKKPYWLDHYLQITFHNLAATYAQLGDFDEAIRVYRRVITLKEQLPDPEPSYLAPSYAELGNVYLEMGDYKEALVQYQEALKLIPKTDPTFTRYAPQYLTSLAKIQLELGNPEQALANMRFAKSIAPDGSEAESSVLLGEIYMKQEKVDLALKAFQKALEEALQNPAGKQKMIAQLYRLTAEGYMKSGLEHKAIPTLDDGLAFLAGTSIEPSHMPFYFYLPPKDSIHFPFEAVSLIVAKVEVFDSMISEANDLLAEEIREFQSYAYELGLELCQEQIASFRADDSKLFWVEKMSDLVQRQVALQGDNYNDRNGGTPALEKGLKAVEVLKAAVLREAIADARALGQSAVPAQLSERLGKLKFECVKLERKLAASPGDSLLQQQLFAAERSLELANDSVFDLVKNSAIGSGLYQPSNLKAIQHALDKTSQLIQFSWSDEQLVIFSIHDTKAELYRLDQVQVLTSLVKTFSNQIQKPEQSSAEELAHAGQELFDQLLKPLGQLKERLIIIPDGPLFNIPFAALLSSKPLGTELSNWPWLMRNHRVSYSSSSSLFIQKDHSNKRGTKSWLGVAPVRFGNGLSSLPLSNQELSGVGEAIQHKGVLLQGAEATKSAFLHSTSQNYSLIHFSTHASSNGNFPGDSWLAFAGEGDTARLFLDELYALPLKTRLVVLSACETQSGKLNKGEGIMSLARAFRYAGSGSVLATLWPSDELASSVVVKQFYKALAEGVSKDEALRQAQLHYLLEAELPADKMHPAYWAPFVMTGDMAPLERGEGFSYWWLLVVPVILFGLWFFVGKNRR